MKSNSEKHSVMLRSGIGFGKYAFLILLIAFFLIGMSFKPHQQSQEKELFDNQDTTLMVNYHPGWATISIPVNGSPQEISELNSGIEIAFAFNDKNKKPYIQTTQLTPGVAYWVKFRDYNSIIFSGIKRLKDSVAVRKGWNFVGSLSRFVAKTSMRIRPSGGVTVMMGPDQYGRWLNNAQTIFPGHGYWVYATTSGTLILNGY